MCCASDRNDNFSNIGDAEAFTPNTSTASNFERVEICPEPGGTFVLSTIDTNRILVLKYDNFVSRTNRRKPMGAFGNASKRTVGWGSETQFLVTISDTTIVVREALTKEYHIRGGFKGRPPSTPTVNFSKPEDTAVAVIRFGSSITTSCSLWRQIQKG